MEGMRFLVNKQRSSWRGSMFKEWLCIYVYYTVDRKFKVNIIRRDEVIWEVEPEYCYRKFYQTSIDEIELLYIESL